MFMRRQVCHGGRCPSDCPRNCPNPPLLLSHLRVVCGGVVRLWHLLARRCANLSQQELEEAALVGWAGWGCSLVQEGTDAFGEQAAKNWVTHIALALHGATNKCFGSPETLQVAAIVPGLFRSQCALDFPVQQRSWGSAQSDLQRPMEHAAIQAMRRISGEVLRREDESTHPESIASIKEMRSVLEGHGVQTAWVVEDVRTLKEDSIAQ